MIKIKKKAWNNPFFYHKVFLDLLDSFRLIYKCYVLLSVLFYEISPFYMLSLGFTYK